MVLHGLMFGSVYHVIVGVYAFKSFPLIYAPVRVEKKKNIKKSGGCPVKMVVPPYP